MNTNETQSPGSLPRRVSHRAKNPNLVAFLQGMNAADSDWEKGDITDCPYRTRLAKRDWWRGYHYYEKMANARADLPPR